jgi:hypothetical protein
VSSAGADLFGSFAEASCAAMVISSKSADLYHHVPAMHFPLVLIASGIFVSLATSFVATHLVKVRSAGDVEASLKRQLVVSTVLQTLVTLALAFAFFPANFGVSNPVVHTKNWHIFVCVMCGLWSGLLIGFTTEYYTSHSYTPVREVSEACKMGAATNIIYGLGQTHAPHAPEALGCHRRCAADALVPLCLCVLSARLQVRDRARVRPGHHHLRVALSVRHVRNCPGCPGNPVHAGHWPGHRCLRTDLRQCRRNC